MELFVSLLFRQAVIRKVKLSEMGTMHSNQLQRTIRNEIKHTDHAATATRKSNPVFSLGVPISSDKFASLHNHDNLTRWRGGGEREGDIYTIIVKIITSE